MAKQLYSLNKVKPRKHRDKTGRKYKIEYDCIYDWGARCEFVGYYRTYIGSRIAAFWNVKMNSWGGTAVLTDQWSE